MLKKKVTAELKITDIDKEAKTNEASKKIENLKHALKEVKSKVEKNKESTDDKS